MDNNWKARQAQAITLAMSRQKMSMVDLSKQSGVSREMIRLFTNGQNISIEALFKILSVLGLEIEPINREASPCLDPMDAPTAPRAAQATIAMYLAEVAKAKGLSTDTIAATTGLLTSTVQCILQNRGEYYISEFIKVAQVLNLHLDLSKRDTTHDLSHSNN